MIIQWEAVETMSPEEIENIRVQVVKDIQSMKDTKFILQEEYNDIKKQQIVLDQKLHELKSARDKQAHLIRQKEADEEILRSKFWSKRNG